MSRTYTQRPCRVCSRTITRAGAAYVAHMRKHVREGAAEEVKATPYGGYSYRVIRQHGESK